MNIFRLFVLLVLVTLAAPVFAAPGDTIYFEDFQNGGANGWSQFAGDGTLAVDDYPPGSGAFALTTCCGVVDARSPTTDTAVPGAQISLTIQRGGNAIGSNKPENADDLDIYFLNDSGAWQFIARLDADGDAAEMLSLVYSLDQEFLHAGFRIRLYQRNGSDASDYWHLHELHIVEAGSSGGLGSLCDAFDEGIGNWTVTSFGGETMVTAQTFASAPDSLALFGGAVRIVSLPLDLAGASAATLSLWVRRGSDAFSENPETGEGLTIGYIDDTGAFQQLADLPGGGAQGEIFNLSYALPANALHDAFQVRIQTLNGSGGDNDYWHIDDVCVDIARTLDHFAIRHDGGGVNCQAEPVEIVAHDADHFVVENHTGGIGLSTDTGNGDWSLLAGNGTVANGGNGSGGYTFVTADDGEVLLGLRDTYIETLNIDAAGSGSVEHVSEDGDLAFAETGFNVIADGSAGPLPAQIAGKRSDVAPNAALIELQAIRTSDETGACEAALGGSVNVDLAMSCEDPATCAAASLQVNGVTVAANPAGAPSLFTTLTLDFGDASDGTAPLVLRYDDAGRIRLHARHELLPSGEIMSGASSTFTVRPFGFHLAAVGNPAALNVNGDAYRKASGDFDVTVTAVGWESGDDANADGVPDGYGDSDASNNADLSDNTALPGFGAEAVPDDVTLSANLWQPAGGNHPGLSGNTAATGFINGTASVTVNYTEAGIIELAVQLADNDYLGAGNVVSRSGPVGRFTPDHFDVSVAQHGCSDANAFTYSGQPIRSLTVTARNAGGGTVQNFSAAPGFAKNVALSEISGASGGVQNGGISALDFSNGSVAVTDVAFAFSAKETVPATIVLRATDTDGVSSQDHTEANTQIRAARFVVGDAEAPVLVAATSRLLVESWDGAEWLEEAQDTCTILDVPALTLGNYTGNLAAGESVIDTGNTNFLNGSGQATLTAPGVGNAGSMQLDYDAESWLEYDWLGTGARDPFGTVRFFDIFATEPGFIDRYEVVP